MEIKNRAYVYLIASLLIGSFTPALLVLTSGTNAFELFFMTSLISIPVGLALVVRNRKLGALKGLLKDRKKLLYTALAGLLIYVPYEYGIAYAEHFISASLAIVLFRLNPLLMLAFLPILLRERLSKRQVLALVIAFVGVLIGISGGNVSNLSANPNLSIIMLVVLLALGYALANVIIKWQMLDNDLYLSASTFTLSLFFGALFLASGGHFAPLSSVSALIILYLAITNIFSFYMYMYALKTLKTTIVTNTFLLSPFLTFIWAAVLLGEPILAYYIAIAVLAGLGIAIQRTDKLGGSYAPKRAHGRTHRFTIFDVTGAFTGEGANEEIYKIINSGGRVLATKLNRSHSYHIAAMASDSRFSHVYTGEEASLASEARFVRDILGVEREEAVVIKAGPDSENEEFFNELNRRLVGGKVTS